MLRAALLLSPDEVLSDDVDLFIEQAVIAVSVVVFLEVLIHPFNLRWLGGGHVTVVCFGGNGIHTQL
jgi:hypothetical protein